MDFNQWHGTPRDPACIMMSKCHIMCHNLVHYFIKSVIELRYSLFCRCCFMILVFFFRQQSSLIRWRRKGNRKQCRNFMNKIRHDWHSSERGWMIFYHKYDTLLCFLFSSCFFGKLGNVSSKYETRAGLFRDWKTWFTRTHRSIQNVVDVST